jgi:hypothetical protein
MKIPEDCLERFKQANQAGYALVLFDMNVAITAAPSEYDSHSLSHACAFANVQHCHDEKTSAD